MGGILCSSAVLSSMDVQRVTLFAGKGGSHMTVRMPYRDPGAHPQAHSTLSPPLFPVQVSSWTPFAQTLTTMSPKSWSHMEFQVR